MLDIFPTNTPALEMINKPSNTQIKGTPKVQHTSAVTPKVMLNICSPFD